MTRLSFSIPLVNAVSAVILSSSALLSSADDWPVYRGPAGTGISNEAGLRDSGEATVTLKAEVGLGYSAPIISSGKVVVSGHDGAKKDTLFCFDEKTGAELWQFSYEQPLGDLYFQGGTTGTATFDGDKIFHVARQGELFCLNASDGSVVWQKHLQNDFEYMMPTWGFTGAPLVQGDRLYITAGEAGLALNKADGTVIWKSDNDEAGYATPYPFEKSGKNLLIFTNKRAYVCVEAESGAEVWSQKWMTRYGVNAADPIVSGDHIFISSGYGKGAVALKWTGAGDPEKVWQSRDMKTQMNAAVLIDGFLYGVDGNESQDGTGLKCIDLLTGETKWAVTDVGHGTLSAVGKKLLVLTEQGTLQIADASPEKYEPTFSQQAVKPRVWTVPVFANGKVYCRNAGGEFVALTMGKNG